VRALGMPGRRWEDKGPRLRTELADSSVRQLFVAHRAWERVALAAEWVLVTATSCVRVRLEVPPELVEALAVATHPQGVRAQRPRLRTRDPRQHRQAPVAPLAQL
jgi:hypothetical protein